jgi:hypothetical protein
LIALVAPSDSPGQEASNRMVGIRNLMVKRVASVT